MSDVKDMEAQWATHHNDSDEIHVVPLGDLYEHDTTASCWCQPRVDLEYPDIYVHNAADDRENFECGNRKPS